MFHSLSSIAKNINVVVSFFVFVQQNDEDAILCSLNILTELIEKRRTAVYDGESDLKNNPGVCVIASCFSDCKTFLMNKVPSSPLNGS